jgi:hypothetical protein
VTGRDPTSLFDALLLEREIRRGGFGPSLTRVESESQFLSTFKIYLPRVEDEADRPTPVAEPPAALFLSGYTEGVVADKGLLGDGAHFLQKPFTGDALEAKVREVLDRPARAVP